MTRPDAGRGWKLRIAVPAAAVLVSALSGLDGPPSGTPAARRWIDSEPEVRVVWDDLYQERRMFEWQGEDLPPVPAGAPVGLLLDRPADLSAELVHEVDVRLDRWPSASLRLEWESDVGGPGASGSLMVPARRVEADGTCRFSVATSTAWHGRIARLRLWLGDGAGEVPAVERMAGVLRALRPQRVRPLLGVPCQVEVDHEVRNGFLAPPGQVLEHRLLVPERARLRAAWAAPAALRQEVTFRVVAKTDPRERTVLMKETVGPGNAALGRWQSATVDLAPLSGREVVLALETAGEGPYDAAQGVPVWANPEVAVADVRDDRPSLLLVVVDALRADGLSLYGCPRPTSPFLDAWARSRAAVFRQVVAPAPWTYPSHVSLFSGVDAVRHGRNHDAGGAGSRVEGNRLEVMAEVLRREGYATAAHTGGAYLHPAYGFSRGFDEYAYWPDRAADLEELPTGVDRALEFAAAHRDGPFFFFLHTYEVHDPHSPRQPYFDRLAPEGVSAPPGEVAVVGVAGEAEEGFAPGTHLALREYGDTPSERRLGETELPLVRALYDSGVARTDAELGRLLTGLDRLGLGSRTVVVVTSDHGDSLGENGRAGHTTLADTDLMVPLMISAPGGRGAGRSVNRQVRLVDLWPTVAELLGAATAPGLDGVSLVPFLDGTRWPGPPEAWSYAPAFNRGLSLRLGGRLKLVFNDTVWPSLLGRRSLFDLARDPGERSDLAPRDPRVDQLAALAREVLERDGAGLRVHLANAGPGTLHGKLWGPAIGRQGVTSTDAGPGMVRAGAPEELLFDLAPGASCTLNLGKVVGRDLAVGGVFDPAEGRPPLSLHFDLEKLGVGQAVVLEEGRWRRLTDPKEPVGTGLELRWHGTAGVQGPSPSTADPEVRRQLEALGYLE